MPKTVDLLTTAQVSELTGVPVRKLNRWVTAGRLTVAVKLPGDTGANLFLRSEVERFIREQAA